MSINRSLISVDRMQRSGELARAPSVDADAQLVGAGGQRGDGQSADVLDAGAARTRAADRRIGHHPAVSQQLGRAVDAVRGP